MSNKTYVFHHWRSNLTSQITSDICLRTYRQDPEMRFPCQYLWSQLLLHLFNIWPTHAPASHFPHLQGLTLAHPVMDIKDFEISLLIGADYYWSVMEDTIIRGDGPTAMKSKLGFLLSGPVYPLQLKDKSIKILHTLVATLGDSVTNFLGFRIHRYSISCRLTIWHSRFLLQIFCNVSTRWILQGQIPMEELPSSTSS